MGAKGETFMIKALVPIADGVEEMEAVIIIDTLRRARWEVVSALVTSLDASSADAEPETNGKGEKAVRASRGVRLLPDAEWRNIEPDSFDVLVLPGGGGGTEVLSSDKSVIEAVQSFVRSGKIVGAICAAPLVLQKAGVLDGRKATCHPAVREELTSADLQDERVVVDGRIVTSQGPGTAFDFALEIIRLIEGADAADAVAAELVL